MRFIALIAVCFGQAAFGQNVVTTSENAVASFEGPTSRYGHAIMGNLPEWSQLCLSHGADRACVTLAETSVFEDISHHQRDARLRARTGNDRSRRQMEPSLFRSI